VVTFFSGLEPGSAATYNLTYELPFRYNMGPEVVIRSVMEKPIGGFAQTVTQTVELPTGYRLAEGSLPKNIQLETDLDLRLVYRR
jgi:hypothetical protein